MAARVRRSRVRVAAAVTLLAALTFGPAVPASAADYIAGCRRSTKEPFVQGKVTYYGGGKSGGVWIKSPETDLKYVDVWAIQDYRGRYPYYGPEHLMLNWSDKQYEGPSHYWMHLPDSDGWPFLDQPDGSFYWWKFEFTYKNGKSCLTKYFGGEGELKP